MSEKAEQILTETRERMEKAFALYCLELRGLLCVFEKQLKKETENVVGRRLS